jgi:ribose transport system substrate-binding protein
VVQNPFKMGYLGVKTIVMHIQGQRVEKLVDTGVTYVSLENFNNGNIQELIYPDLERWLGQ